MEPVKIVITRTYEAPDLPNLLDWWAALPTSTAIVFCIGMLLILSFACYIALDALRTFRHIDAMYSSILTENKKDQKLANIH